MNGLDPRLVLACIAFSGLIGALVGIVFAGFAAKRIVAAALPPFPEFVAVQQINLLSTVVDQGENVLTRQVISTSAPEISAHFVEKWLTSRDLVMSPKGQDFSIKRKPKAGA